MRAQAPTKTLHIRQYGGRVCDLKNGMIVFGPRGGKHTIKSITSDARNIRTITTNRGLRIEAYYLADMVYGEYRTA